MCKIWRTISIDLEYVTKCYKILYSERNRKFLIIIVPCFEFFARRS